MNEQQTLQMSLSLLANMTAIVSNMSSTARNTLGIFLDSFRDNENAKILKKHLGGGNEFCTLEGPNINDLKKELDRAGIPYVEMKGLREHGDGKILIRDKDFWMLDRAFQESILGTMGGIRSKEDLWDYSKGDVLRLKGLSDVEAAIVGQEAKKKGFPVTIRNREKDKYDILFAEKDIDKMTRVTTSLAYDRSDKPYWDIIEREMKHRLKLANDAMDKAVNKKEACWIVGQSGQDLYVSPFHVDVMEKNGKHSASYRKKFDKKIIRSYVGRMEYPVTLTVDEYAKYAKLKTDEERRAFRNKIREEHGRPSRSKEDFDILQKHGEARKLYERKLSGMNPLNQYRSNSVYNEEVDIEGDEQIKRDNAEFSHDKEESFKPDPNLINDANAYYEMIDIDEYHKSPAYDVLEEYIVTRNEKDKEKYKEMLEKWKYQDNGYNKYEDDKNHNNIPDVDEDRDEEPDEPPRNPDEQLFREAMSKDLSGVPDSLSKDGDIIEEEIE